MSTKSVLIGFGDNTIKLNVTSNEDADSKVHINKKTNELVSGVIKFSYFPSVNSMYIIAHRHKTLCKEARDMRENAFLQLSYSHSRDLIPEDCYIRIEMAMYMTHSFNRRDVDNTVKFLQDTLAEYYKFNDNRVVNLNCSKWNLIDSNDGNEVLFYRIIKEDRDVNVNFSEVL